MVPALLLNRHYPPLKVESNTVANKRLIVIPPSYCVFIIHKVWYRTSGVKARKLSLKLRVFLEFFWRKIQPVVSKVELFKTALLVYDDING
jgi:hypothetical protein